MPCLCSYWSYIRFVTNPEGQLPGMPHDPVKAPPIVVDLDLDDIPDTSFSQYKFRNRIGDDTVVVTLQMDNDHLLANFTEWARNHDVYDLYARFFEYTAKSLVYEDGSDVDAQQYLKDQGEDVEETRRSKLDDYRSWKPDEIVEHDKGWLPDLGPADVLAHWLYQEVVSLKKLSQVAQSALAQWSDELTDSSMRPQRLSRRDRRASGRRR